MPIVASAWKGSLIASLSAKGMTGAKLSEFANAVGSGSAKSIIGKSFSTIDVGTAPGAGVGTGIGITGVQASAIKNQIYAQCVSSFGQGGSKLMDFAEAVANACVQMIQQATLNSSHGPVFAGSGTITPGSIAVNPSEWASNIRSAGSSLQGSQWGNFSNALGQAQASAIQSLGTGNVSIAGAPAAPVTFPSSGVGSGTIS